MAQHHLGLPTGFPDYRNGTPLTRQISIEGRNSTTAIYLLLHVRGLIQNR